MGLTPIITKQQVSEQLTLGWLHGPTGSTMKLFFSSIYHLAFVIHLQVVDDSNSCFHEINNILELLFNNPIYIYGHFLFSNDRFCWWIAKGTFGRLRENLKYVFLILFQELL